MRALAWLNKLRRNESGNVLAITAASMPLILGGAAMAIDTIQLSVWKRQLQRAADSAAIAGAYAEGQGADPAAAVHNDLDENVFPTLSVPEVVEEGPRLGFNRTVHVSLTAERTVPFISFFTNRPNTLTAEATAALVDDGEFCMLSLYDGDDVGINANGNATVNLVCGMYSNSHNDDSSVTAGGSSSIIATPISSVGALDGDGQNFGGNTTLRPYSAPMADPFADVPLPTVPATGCSETVAVGNNDAPLTIGPDDDEACAGSWNIDGDLILESGVYYVNGGNIDLKGTVRSTGPVTIIMTGNQTNSDGDLVVGDFIQNGGGELIITASDSGDYRGIALYRDPRANLLTVKINGGAETAITGAIYMPSTDLWLGGNARFDATCLQVVARIITFRGGANITNNCTEGGGAQALRQTVVRLVG